MTGLLGKVAVGDKEVDVSEFSSGNPLPPPPHLLLALLLLLSTTLSLQAFDAAQRPPLSTGLSRPIASIVVDPIRSPTTFTVDGALFHLYRRQYD